jgi:hypothetical protein
MDGIIVPVALENKDRRTAPGIGVVLDDGRGRESGENVIDKDVVGGKLAEPVLRDFDGTDRGEC